MVKFNKSSNLGESGDNKKLVIGEFPYNGLIASNLTDNGDPHNIYDKYSKKKPKKPQTIKDIRNGLMHNAYVINDDTLDASHAYYNSSNTNSVSNEKISIIRNGLMHGSYIIEGDKMYIDNPKSYPTVIETIPLKNFLSIVMNNHPGYTIDEVIKLMTDNYLIEKQYKYKDVDGNIREGSIYSIDIEKFNKDELGKPTKKD